MKRIPIIAGLLILFTFTWAIGQDYSLSFNGTNSRVVLPTDLFSTSNFTSELTIEYWYKGTNLTSPVRFQNGDYIVPGYPIGEDNIYAIMSTNGEIYPNLYPNLVPVICTKAEVNNNQWHHIAVTWERHTANGYKTYFDGVLRDSKDAVDTALPEISAGWLGAYNNGEYITGQLDEVRIWKVERTASDIQQNMNKELSGNEAGLVAYYKMSNGSGTILSDDQTNGTKYNGTLDSATWMDLTAPSIQATDVNFSQVYSNIMNVAWTNGNSTYRVVFAKQGYSGTAIPETNVSYTANSTFGSGDQIGTSGWYCIYNGTGSSLIVGGLTANTPYIFHVCEYTNPNKWENFSYLSDSASNNPNTQSTNNLNNSNLNFALDFDGNDFVNLPSTLYSDNISNGTALTIEYWFKGDILLSPVRFQDPENHYVVAGWLNPPQFIISNDGGTSGVLINGTGDNVEDGNWHHIACIRSQNGIMATYVDGELSHSRSANNELMPAISSTGHLGANKDDEYLTGQLEEVRIWNVARTASEIHDNMNKELTGNETGLVAYYKMSNGSGPTLSDDKTNGTKYDGTITGAAWALVNPESLTLPVELSAFTANYTASNTVSIIWTTQSETNMIGYHILRADDNNLENANRISDNLIQAVNISTEHNYSYTDMTTQQNTEYYYWLQSAEMDGTIEYYGPIKIKTGEPQITPPVILLVTQLKSAYPNPFNPSTMISFDIAQQDRVVIEIFNSKGQKIKTLYDQVVSPGHHQVLWDGTDSNSTKSSSGMYFYRMTAGKYSETHKILMMK